MSNITHTFCELCKRNIELTFDHLIPRSLHSNKWFEKNFDKEYMKSHGIYVCRDCHDMIHNTFDEKTLWREYNTLEKLLSVESIIKWSLYFSKK